MSHPAYKPPPALCTKAKVAKGGVYLRDTTVSVLLIPLHLVSKIIALSQSSAIHTSKQECLLAMHANNNQCATFLDEG